ncbi:MAG: DUF4350 domain-containing protein [Armatimonadota bacterium]
MRRWRLVILLVAGLVLASGLRTYLRLHSPALDPVHDYSSLRTNRTGTKALRQLCRHYGLRIDTFTRPASEIPADARLVAFINPFRPFTAEEFKRLEEWVQQGGHLIVAVRDGPIVSQDGRSKHLNGNHAVLAWLGLVATKFQGDALVTAVEACPWPGYDIRNLSTLAPAELIIVRSRAEVRRHLLLRGEDLEILSELPAMATVRTLGMLRVDGLCLGVSLGLGQGRVDVLTDANLLSNYHLGKADNALLAAALFLPGSEGKVLFDEYHHGIGSPQYSPSAKTKFVLWAALLLLLLALTTYFGFGLMRLGRARVYRERPRRSVGEYVQAVAWLYQRANQRKSALSALAQSTRRRWALRLGVSPNSSPEQFAAAARSRHIAWAETLERVLTAVAVAEEAEDLTPERFVRLGALLQRLQAALDL